MTPLTRLFNKLTGNKQADFIGTRRIEKIPWFALVGVAANDGPDRGKNPNPAGSPHPHQSFLIGKGPATVTIKTDMAGYLYAFANDAWHLYGNNRGSVDLVVTRT